PCIENSSPQSHRVTEKFLNLILLQILVFSVPLCLRSETHFIDLFRSLAAKHTANTAHDAAHGENAFVIRKKYFTTAAAAVVPAFQQCEMLHGFKRGPRLHRRECVENCLHSRLHGLRFFVLDGLNREHGWPGDRSAFYAKEGDRICVVAGLNDQRRKSVKAAGDL